nr:nitroreductase family protein [Sulfitobacter mediterraneus]
MLSDFADILAQRRSIRAYTSDRVERATLERICLAARRAPSGANLQPRNFHVLTETALEGLIARLTAAQQTGEPISED